jgi:hypothetical protein
VSEEPTSPEERIGRTLIGGYDREQVEAALRERDERLEKLEREAQLLAGKVVLAERRAAEVRFFAGGVPARATARVRLRRRRSRRRQTPW